MICASQSSGTLSLTKRTESAIWSISSESLAQFLVPTGNDMA
jgi:hypothetical protein